MEMIKLIVIGLIVTLRFVAFGHKSMGEEPIVIVTTVNNDTCRGWLAKILGDTIGIAESNNSNVRQFSAVQLERVTIIRKSQALPGFIVGLVAGGAIGFVSGPADGIAGDLRPLTALAAGGLGGLVGLLISAAASADEEYSIQGSTANFLPVALRLTQLVNDQKRTYQNIRTN